MIINEYVKINITTYNLKKYKKLGYKVELNDVIMFPVSNLKMGSNIKIYCKCDVCGKISNIRYQYYNRNIEKVDIMLVQVNAQLKKDN